MDTKDAILKIQSLRSEQKRLQDNIIQIQKDVIGPLRTEFFELDKQVYDIMSQAMGVSPERLSHGQWDCPENPFTGTCIYDVVDDPTLDECVFCHLPDERK